jgi:threonine aldolase
MEKTINLTSDTATQPTQDMRRAMADAPVGDEQRREDPTVNRLVERAAHLLGKETAVFLPSATMANQIALAVQCRGGEQILAHRLSHAFNFEAGAPAYLSRVMTRPLDGHRGMFDSAAVEGAVDSKSYHRSPSRLLLVENTTNLGGGAVWPISQLAEVADTARGLGMVCHMDGSRLMNAAVALGLPASEISAPFDSVTLCFSKGLGAPVGAALAGSQEFIDAAWRYKHIFGGAMRQSGIIAAAALYALEYHVDRLAEDHRNAKLIAQGIAGLPGIRINPENIETNIIVFEVDPETMSAEELSRRMQERGVLFHALGKSMCRLVTHLDLTAAMAGEAIARFQALLAD